MPGGIKVTADFFSPAFNQPMFRYDGRHLPGNSLVINKWSLHEKALQSLPLLHILQKRNAGNNVFDLFFVGHWRVLLVFFVMSSVVHAATENWLLVFLQIGQIISLPNLITF